MAGLEWTSNTENRDATKLDFFLKKFRNLSSLTILTNYYSFIWF